MPSAAEQSAPTAAFMYGSGVLTRTRSATLLRRDSACWYPCGKSAAWGAAAPVCEPVQGQPERLAGPDGAAPGEYRPLAPLRGQQSLGRTELLGVRGFQAGVGRHRAHEWTLLVSRRAEFEPGGRDFEVVSLAILRPEPAGRLGTVAARVEIGPWLETGRAAERPNQFHRRDILGRDHADHDALALGPWDDIDRQRAGAEEGVGHFVLHGAGTVTSPDPVGL